MLALLALPSCDREPRGRDVVLITVDTLRADHVGLYGYARPTTPQIDRWFVDGAVYLRSYSTEANTSPSVVSILSGLLPQEHRVRLFYQLAAPDLATIATLLPGGYERAAFVSNLVLTDEAIGLARHFDHYDDFVDEPEPFRPVYERNATRTTDAVLRWLAVRAVPDRPLFLWVHYIDPHGPYRAPPSWPRSFGHPEPQPVNPASIPEYEREPGVTDGLAYVDAYDEEIAYVDSEIGRLLAGYAARRPIDRALVVLTADHGESMMEHERWFRHGYHVYDEIVRVPLLLRGPGVARGRFADLTSGIDVAPTVLRFAGGTVPASMRGADLRSRRGLDAARAVFAEATGETTQQRRAAIQGDRKWMVELRGGRSPVTRREYDLAADPAERRPRPWKGAADAARALLDLCRTDPDPAGVPRQYAKGMQLLAPKVAPGVSAETRAKLGALGYAD